MNTIIVPVDFSDTSLNAANFAGDFLKGNYAVKMIIYHSYAKESETANVIALLEGIKEKLLATHPGNIEILAHVEDDFLTGLERAVRHRNADLVIMGINSKSPLAQVFFESNALKMSRTKACPVLAIPQNVQFTQLKNVMLASDFKDTLNSTPSQPLKNFLSLHSPLLHIVNVDKGHYISLSEEYEKEKQHLKTLLADYKPEFYFMRLFDTTEAIDMFAADRHIDLIILVQKDHSFMEKIFGGTTTIRQLTYESKLPVLLIHQ